MLNCWSASSSSSWCGPLLTCCSWAPRTDLTMPLVVDAVWAVWSIAAGVYDYFHTSAMEERIHTLEHVLSIHQFVIAGLSAGLVLLMTYILWRKHWWVAQFDPWALATSEISLLPSITFLTTFRMSHETSQELRRTTNPEWRVICSIVICPCCGSESVKQEIQSLSFTIVTVCMRRSVTSRTWLIPIKLFIGFSSQFYSRFYATPVSVNNVHVGVNIMKTFFFSSGLEPKSKLLMFLSTCCLFCHIFLSLLTVVFITKWLLKSSLSI